MQVRALAAGDWRNWKDVSLSTAGKWNLITGQNGSGKTAILEIMWALTRQRTVRGQSLRMIPKRSPNRHCWARVEFCDQKGEHVLQMEYGDTIVYRLDGDPVNAATAAWQFPSVLLQPSDISLVTGDPVLRREFLLRAAFQKDQNILNIYKGFQSALVQRNRLIRQIREGVQTEDQLLVWDAVFLPRAVATELAMKEVWKHLLPRIVRLLAELFPGIIIAAELRLSLLEDWQPDDASITALLHATDRLENLRSRELQRGYSLCGPQRVDFVLRLSEAPAKEVGSQGQLRAIAIAIRLAAAQYMADHLGEMPVILMDDMAGEIDDQRSAGLLSWLHKQDCQLWLSATDARHFPPQMMEYDLQHWQTENGTVTPHN